jgi:hypothetical protein
MKKYLIILFIYASQAAAQSAKGSMDCTVTGSVVVATEEGKFNTYSNIEGGVKANDKLTLNYDVKSDSIYIQLERNNAEKFKLKNTVISAYQTTKDSNILVESGKGGGFVLTEKTFNHSISFTPDYIRIGEFRELFISRYYKNDWHGIFSYVSQISAYTQTLTLNCRHINDKMDDAFKIFTGDKK